MNHIFAALFAIGILFAIYTGTTEARDPVEIRAAITQVRGAVDGAQQAPTPAEATARLEAVDEPLSTLTGAVTRLPRGYGERLTLFQASLEAARTTLGEAVSPSAESAAAVAGLARGWTQVEELGGIDNTGLLVASLAEQGRTSFEQTMERAKTAVLEIAFPLIGLMAFWLGMMRVAEAAGLVQALARAINPFFRVFFPKVPKDHPANGAILMSLSANIIGLDNAATPLSLKAMKELQSLNKEKETLTNDQGMLLTLNATSITVIPFGIIAYRLSVGSTYANDIILPAIIATTCSTVTGVIIWVFVRRFSRDTAAEGAEAQEITDQINAEIAGEREESK